MVRNEMMNIVAMTKIKKSVMYMYMCGLTWNGSSDVGKARMM